MGWSVIVPQAGTNLSANPSAEINASTGFGGIGIGTALAQTDDESRWGNYSLRVTPGAAVNAGVRHSITGASIGETYTGSAWVLGAAGVPYHIYFGDAAGAVKAGCTPTTFTGDGTWHRYEVQFVADAANLYICVSKNNSVSVSPVYIDGWQVEEAVAATTYIDGTRPGCEWDGVPHLSSSSRVAQDGGGGQIISLDDYDINVTHDVGLGVAPLRHRVLSTPNLPGAILEGVHTEPRVLTLACWASAPPLDADDSALDQARAALVDALKPDRAPKLQPVTLYYESATREFELHAYYESGLERNITEWRFEAFILRFICYDPALYEIGETADPLDVEDSGTLRYVCARLRGSGQWDMLGPPASGDTVYCVLVAPDGDIYVGGAFTNWDGQAGLDYLVRWDGSSWNAVGSLSAFNKTVYALCMSPNPRELYVGGLFTNADGDADADYICLYGMDGNTIAAVGAGGTGVVYALALAPNGDLYVGGDFANWNAIAAADYIVMWDLSAGAWAAVGDGLNNIVRALVVERFTGNLYAGGAFSQDGGAVAMRCVAMWDGSDWSEVGGGLDTAVNTGCVYALAFDAAGNLYAGGAFTQTDDGLITDLSNAARWDGNSWKSLGTGCDDTVYALAVGRDGIVHLGGNFTGASDLNAHYYARWNGYSWMQPDIIIPGPVVYAIALSRPNPVIDSLYNIVLGGSIGGTAYYAGSLVLDNTGSRQAYPWFDFLSTGGTSSELISIRNETNGLEMSFSGLYLLDGETVTVDCRPGQMRIYSDRRDNLMGYLRRPSDFAGFVLEPGENQITCLVQQVGGPTVVGHILWMGTYWSVDAA